MTERHQELLLEKTLVFKDHYRQYDDRHHALRRTTLAKGAIDFGSAANTHVASAIYPGRFWEDGFGENVARKSVSYPSLASPNRGFEIMVASCWTRWFGIPVAMDQVVSFSGVYGAYRTLAQLLSARSILALPSIMHQQHKACFAVLHAQVRELPIDEKTGLPVRRGWESSLSKWHKTGCPIYIYLNHTLGPSLTSEYLDWIETILTKYQATLWYDVDTLFVSHAAGYNPTAILKRPRLRKRTIFLGTLSKEFNLPGIRIGYAVADRSVVEAIRRFQVITLDILSPTNLWIGEQSLRLGRPKRAATIFEKRMLLLRHGFERRGFVCRNPAQGINLFVRIPESFIKGCIDCIPSEVFAYYLLVEVDILVRPDTLYGLKAGDHIRLVVSQDEGAIADFFERLDKHGISGTMSLPRFIVRRYRQFLAIQAKSVH